MRLAILLGFARRSPLNYGEAKSPARVRWHLRTVCLAAASLSLMLSSTAPAVAQQANQPSFDPRQTERRFDALESGQTESARSRLRVPQLARSQAAGDTRPQIELRAVVIP